MPSRQSTKKGQQDAESSQEFGLYRCHNDKCQEILEIPRCTKYMRCPACQEVVIRDYFTFAHIVTVSWLMGRCTGPRSPSLPAQNRTRLRNPDEPDEMLQAVQVDLDAHQRDFGEDVMLITRQNSSSSIMFNVHCCSQESADSIAPAIADAMPQQQSGKKKESLCKVCMDKKPEIVLRPCNHGGLCESCMRQMMSGGGQRTCPWCREPVEKVLKFDATSSTVARARVLVV